MRSVANAGLLLLTASLVMANPGRAQKTSKSSATPAAKSPVKTGKPDPWVERTLKKMTLDEKLGQMLMVYYFGGFTSTESQEYKDLLEQIERNHAGGFVVRTRGGPLGVVRSQVYPTAALANQLQSRAKVPLLVGADFERGTSMRLEEGTSFPQIMAVAATGNVKDAYEMGRITALEARAAGVNWVFAPVADVNNNPENPIINVRSFGEDPRQVSELTAAFVRGVEESGALSTAKHFPGHGDTSTDSHIDLPTVKADRARLDSVELAPFRAAIAAGTSTIMTGHLAIPALEPDPDVPATLSRHVLSGLLRKAMGFEGIIVTDAMEMGGITVRYAPADSAVRSVEAGADMLLVPPVPNAALAALKQAVESGRIPMSRIDASVRRVLAAKARLGLHKNRMVDLNALNSAFRRPEFAAVAQDMADRGITLLRDDARLLPLDATRPQRVLLAIIAGDPDVFPGEDLERELRWRVDRLDVVRTDTRFAKAENVKLPPLENYDRVVIAMFVRVADSKGTVGLPAEHLALVNQLLASGKPAVVASFGSPYLISGFPTAKTWLAGFSTVDTVQRAAVRAIFGQVAIAGKIPVNVPGVARIGDGMRVAANPMTLREAPAEFDARLGPAYAAVEHAIAEGAFPGAVLAVGHRGELAVRAFGRQTYDAKSAAVATDTIYDAASLSKAVVTSTAIAMLITTGRLQLDQPIARFLPEFVTQPAGVDAEWRRRVTVRHLLTHTGGLVAHRPFFAQAKSKPELLKLVFAEPLESEPGAKAQYSDLGFILLGEIIERLSGKPVDAFAQERIFAPLAMRDTMYHPPRSLHPRIAPTETDMALRKRTVHGEVHDENAFVMGGAAGHAGMFSTVRDLAAFAQMMLNGGIYGHQRLLPRRAIEQFTARQNVGSGADASERGLGWVNPTEPSSSGKYFSPRSFGHTGFTGTSLWVDPEKELFVILLTNRVHPTRDNAKIDAARPAIHDTVVEALALAPVPSLP